MHGAVAALQNARPELRALSTARQALGLEPYELLHAGPPLRDPCRPPAPLASSIVMTCLHEGWAADEPAAEALLRSGRLRLAPAQDRGCVTPLAAVVSPGTPLFEVHDAGSGATVQAPVSTVRGADTRMGHRDPALLERLRKRDAELAPALRAWMGKCGPVDLWPLALQGLCGGDDLHSRTTAANAALSTLMSERGAGPLANDVGATPLFFLTIWMAGSALMLRLTEGADVPGLVTRAGGNGETFAIALARDPSRWRGCIAEAPSGALTAGSGPSAIAGAIGDSAVIDVLGFGGQCIAGSPEPLCLVAPWLPPDHATLAARLGVAQHASLAPSALLGIDAVRVIAHRAAPLVMLAMIAAGGVGGFMGRGVYRPPVALFEQALSNIAGIDPFGEPAE